MANCPKCGRKLGLKDWKPNCPGCGVNLVYYGMEERLLDEADIAEAESAKLQKRIDRLKASFIGSPFTIARIVLSLLPIAALMIPLCSVTYSGPFIEQTTSNINAIEIYNFVSSLNFDSLLTMLGSNLLGNAFIGLAGSLVAILLSAVFVLVSLFALMAACGPKGNSRNLTLNSISIVLAVASIFLFNMFSNGVAAVFPDFFSGKIGAGIFVYLAALALLLGINIFLTIKGTEVKYKQCYVGGIPYEEYVELVNKGTPKEEIRAMMTVALEKKEAEKAEKAEKAEAK